MTVELKDSIKEKIAEALKSIGNKNDERVAKHEELFSVMKQFEAVKTASGHPISVGVRNQQLNINGVVAQSRVITLEKRESFAGGLTSENVFAPLGHPFCYAYWTPHDTNYWLGGFNAVGPLGVQVFGCLEELIVGLVEKVAAA